MNNGAFRPDYFQVTKLAIIYGIRLAESQQSSNKFDTALNMRYICMDERS